MIIIRFVNERIESPQLNPVIKLLQNSQIYNDIDLWIKTFLIKESKPNDTYLYTNKKKKLKN